MGMYRGCLDAVISTMYSCSKQVMATGGLGEAFSALKLKITHAFYGDLVDDIKVGDHPEWIEWKGDIPFPRQDRQDDFERGVFTTTEMLAVMGYISRASQGTNDRDIQQKLEASRGLWSNLMNSQQTQTESQNSKVGQMMSGESTELQSANQHAARSSEGGNWLSDVIRSLAGALAGA